MARPAFLLCDSDAVIQFLLAGEVRPFEVLKGNYSIQPVIMPEVEIELQSHRKFGQRIAPQLKKVLAHRLIVVLDKQVLESHYGRPPAGALAATAALTQIAEAGRKYQRYVDFGEAYTHAAALAINAPVLSHDRSALNALLTAKLPVPATVLRAFDLIALCNQINKMSDGECDDFRKFLVAENEWIPACFKNNSYANGLREYSPRLVDCKFPIPGKQESHPSVFAAVIDL